jgi:transcriptional regulator with XRE-family HTH domain
MSPEQCRAARGWLGWTQQELARRAGVGLSTVRDFEKGERTPIPNNLAAIRRAIEDAGIRLVFDEGGGATGLTIGKAGREPAAKASGATDAGE